MNQLTADGDLARAFASVRDALVPGGHGDGGEEVRDRIAQRPYANQEVEDAMAGARFALLGRENFNPFEPGAAPMKAFRVVRKS
jgi:hypothetical protein